jgi:hypothetical protein
VAVIFIEGVDMGDPNDTSEISSIFFYPWLSRWESQDDENNKCIL